VHVVIRLSPYAYPKMVWHVLIFDYSIQTHYQKEDVMKILALILALLSGNNKAAEDLNRIMIGRVVLNELHALCIESGANNTDVCASYDAARSGYIALLNQISNGHWAQPRILWDCAAFCIFLSLFIFLRKYAIVRIYLWPSSSLKIIPYFMQLLRR